MQFSNPEELLLFNFFSIYLCNLESNVKYQDKLKSEVSFHSDEANTDRSLKETTKNFLLDNRTLEFDEDCTFTLKIDSAGVVCNLSDLSRFVITNVFLPEELLDNHKEFIRSKKGSTYTNPDLYIQIQDKLVQKDYFLSLELKSTKNDKIPGSSAQQVDPYEWTIFVKHSNKNIEVVTGLYANTITGRLPFPDRSPRPEVSFSQLKTWNNQARKKTYDGFSLNINSNDLNNKVSIIYNWERVLVNEWLTYVKSDNSVRKWFDRTQRVFVYDLLEYYETLTPEQKIIFKLRNKI